MTHEHTPQEICGETRCGKCYEEFLHTAPDRNRKVKFAELPEKGIGAPKFRGHGQKQAPRIDTDTDT